MSLFQLEADIYQCVINKCALSGLRQFLVTESPLKLMKTPFYFTLKALFVLKIFRFLCWFFGHVEKRFYQKHNINFKI